MLGAAAQLFAKQGYQATTMEQVAEAADVGIGTLYNYFGAKDRLLLGVFADATEELLAKGQAAVAKPGGDAVKVTCQLLEIYEQLGTLFEKPVMREMLAASLSQSSDSLEEFTRLDQQLAAQIGELLAGLQTRGKVRKGVDVAAASLAVYGALVLPLLLFLGVPSMDRATLHQMVEQQVRVVFQGLLPGTSQRRSR